MQWYISAAETLLDESLRRRHPWRRGIAWYLPMVTEVIDSFLEPDHLPPTGNSHPSSRTSLSTLSRDLHDIRNQFEALQSRMDRIANIATAIIAIEENKRAQARNRNLTRLTYLAVLFVPMSFVSSFFSMTEDVSALTGTFWRYFAVALPLTVISLAAADFLRVKKWWKAIRMKL